MSASIAMPIPPWGLDRIPRLLGGETVCAVALRPAGGHSSRPLCQLGPAFTGGNEKTGAWFSVDTPELWREAPKFRMIDSVFSAQSSDRRAGNWNAVRRGRGGGQTRSRQPKRCMSDASTIILESAVRRAEGCVHGGAEQGATTRNSGPIARSCNAAMRRCGRTVRPVA